MMKNEQKAIIEKWRKAIDYVPNTPVDCNIIESMTTALVDVYDNEHISYRLRRFISQKYKGIGRTVDVTHVNMDKGHYFAVEVIDGEKHYLTRFLVSEMVTEDEMKMLINTSQNNDIKRPDNDG